MNYDYHFTTVERCPMCEAPAADFRVRGLRQKGRQGFRPQRQQTISTTIVECPACGLLLSNPRPEPLDISQHYGVPPEDYWRPNYFALDPSYYGDLIATFRRRMGTRAEGARVLDVGSGIGKGLRALAHAGFDAYGLEPGEVFVKKAIELGGIAPERLQLAMVEQADYPDAHFDWIIFSAVLEHVAEPGQVLERVLRWLRPGGLIQAEVPNAGWLIARLIDASYRLRGLPYTTHLSPMHRPYHLYEFRPASFQRHGARVGYRVAEHRFMVCETFLPRWADPLVVPLMRATDTGMQLEVWLEKV